jgi:hypothetical protein
LTGAGSQAGKAEWAVVGPQWIKRFRSRGLAVAARHSTSIKAQNMDAPKEIDANARRTRELDQDRQDVTAALEEPDDY